MKSISEIDSNLKVETSIEREKLTFHNARTEPFKIYGIYHDGKKFRRLPYDVAEKTNSGVQYLSSNTAGGRVRFITDSPYIVVKAVLPHNVKFSHMPLTAIAGFDMYLTENGISKVVKTYVPPVDFEDSYEGGLVLVPLERGLVTNAWLTGQ
ncbi:MAG: hypothetical protein E7612_09035 [Ruminococcaceae bacterium]|nr:hypothetical protein [Oscillospiraceae bacterium]